MRVSKAFSSEEMHSHDALMTGFPSSSIVIMARWLGQEQCSQVEADGAVCRLLLAQRFLT